MSKVKAQRVSKGMIASERFVDVLTADGVEEQVVVADSQVKGGYLFVSEIGGDAEKVLVELPREAMSGRWRVWLRRDQLEPTP